MDLKRGQRLKCIKSWQPLFKDYRLIEGVEYQVIEVTADRVTIEIAEDSMSLTWMGSIPITEYHKVPFMMREVSEYFLVPEKKKCDCGFVPDVSAVHYRWCQTLELIP